MQPTKSTFKTPEEIQKALAQRVKQLRLNHNVTQSEIARKTQISVHSIQNLETSGKASVATLAQVLNVLGVDASEIIPLPSVSAVDPIAILEKSQPRKRARASG